MLFQSGSVPRQGLLIYHLYSSYPPIRTNVLFLIIVYFFSNVNRIFTLDLEMGLESSADFRKRRFFPEYGNICKGRKQKGKKNVHHSNYFFTIAQVQHLHKIKKPSCKTERKILRPAFSHNTFPKHFIKAIAPHPTFPTPADLWEGPSQPPVPAKAILRPGCSYRDVFAAKGQWLRKPEEWTWKFRFC